MTAHPTRSVLLAFLLTALAGCGYTQFTPPPDAGVDPAEPTAPRNYSDGEFAEITPYGEWIHTASFGWAWQPRVREAWQPFVYGHWVWSEWGWTWISYEAFGWAVYHYGSWVYDSIWEWIWIPGYEWSPNRVQWAVYDDYVCWAPAGPEGVYYGDPWDAPLDNAWVVCDPAYFTHTNIVSYSRRGYRPDAPRLQTQVAFSAPTVDAISQRTKKTVRSQPIKIQKRRIGNHEIQRMKLPPEQQGTVDRYQRRVEKNITPPASRDQDASRSKSEPADDSSNSKSNRSKKSSRGKDKSSR